MAYLYNDTFEEWLDEDTGEIFDDYAKMEESHRWSWFSAANLGRWTKLWRSLVGLFWIPKPQVKVYISPDEIAEMVANRRAEEELAECEHCGGTSTCLQTVCYGPF